MIGMAILEKCEKREKVLVRRSLGKRFSFRYGNATKYGKCLKVSGLFRSLCNGCSLARLHIYIYLFRYLFIYLLIYLHLEHAEQEQAAVAQIYTSARNQHSLSPSLPHSLSQTLQLPIIEAPSTAMEIFA